MKGDAELFERHRALLMGIAYRMLASSAEAEDVVQDAWLRWQAVEVDAVEDVRAWLTTTVARLSLDRLKSARARREIYPGTWLPEPVLTTTPLDLESIKFGFLVLLERLDPKERAVFLLHQVFDHSHAEIAEMLGMSEAASRQALHRAKEHVAENRPRFDVSRETHLRLLSAFVAAVARGEVDAISDLVAQDVLLVGDHEEGKRGAILKPIVGRDKVARFFATQGGKAGGDQQLTVEITDANGWPALVGRRGGAVAFVMNIETDGERITTIRSVLNPHKLTLRHAS
jgi:RNA polymerase sigma-70 factor (ECF subfamily)